MWATIKRRVSLTWSSWKRTFSVVKRCEVQGNEASRSKRITASAASSQQPPNFSIFPLENAFLCKASASPFIRQFYSYISMSCALISSLFEFMFMSIAHRVFFISLRISLILSLRSNPCSQLFSCPLTLYLFIFNIEATIPFFSSHQLHIVSSSSLHKFPYRLFLWSFFTIADFIFSSFSVDINHVGVTTLQVLLLHRSHQI